MAEAKRHHYVPRVLLRRFSSDPEADNPPLWRLDKKSGRPSHTSVANEAVIRHYYRIDEPTPKLTSASAEQDLARLEAEAAEPIRKLSAGAPLSIAERVHMAFFLFMLQQRTPRGRLWMTSLHEHMAQDVMKAGLKHPEFVRMVFEDMGDKMTDEEMERWRVETLRDLEQGKIRLEYGQDHEVAGMFAAADRMVPFIAGEMTWRSLRTSPGNTFVIADHPVVMHDPKAPADAGVGWGSSPTVEVTVPIDPGVCLLLTPGPDTWSLEDVGSDAVGEINLRSYASAEWSIYGPSQQAVQDVRGRAKRFRARVASLAPRAPRFISIESVKGEPTPPSITIHRPPPRPQRRRKKA